MAVLTRASVHSNKWLKVNKFMVETSVITNRRQERTCENASSLSQSSENVNERCVSSKVKKAGSCMS